MSLRAPLSFGETPQAAEASAALTQLRLPDRTMVANFQARAKAQQFMSQIEGPDTFTTRPRYGFKRNPVPRPAAGPLQGLGVQGAPIPQSSVLRETELAPTVAAPGGALDKMISRLSAPSASRVGGDATLARVLSSTRSAATTPASAATSDPEVNDSIGGSVSTTPRTQALSPPAAKRANLTRGPAAVPTQIPTTSKDDEDDEMTSPAQASSFGAVNRAASLFNSLAPDIVNAATAKTKQARSAADSNLAIGVGTQVANEALSGSGDFLGDVASLASQRRDQRGARIQPATVMKTGTDLVTAAQRTAAALPGLSPTATSPVVQKTASLPQPPAEVPPVASPPPTQAATEPQSSAPTPSTKPASEAADPMGDAEAEQDEQGVKATAVKAADEAAETGESLGEDVAKKAAGEAVGEGLGEASADAIPGVGEIAAGVLGLVSLLAMNRKPRQIAPPTESVQSFQAGL